VKSLCFCCGVQLTVNPVKFYKDLPRECAGFKILKPYSTHPCISPHSASSIILKHTGTIPYPLLSPNLAHPNQIRRSNTETVSSNNLKERTSACDTLVWLSLVSEFEVLWSSSQSLEEIYIAPNRKADFVRVFFPRTVLLYARQVSVPQIQLCSHLFPRTVTAFFTASVTACLFDPVYNEEWSKPIPFPQVDPANVRVNPISVGMIGQLGKGLRRDTFLKKVAPGGSE